MGPLGTFLLRPQLQRATLSRGNGLWASSRCNSRYSGCIGLSRRSFCNAGAASLRPGLWTWQQQLLRRRPPYPTRTGLIRLQRPQSRCGAGGAARGAAAFASEQTRMACYRTANLHAERSCSGAAGGRVVSGAAAEGHGTSAREQTCVM
jgi:hypothetical protein